MHSCYLSIMYICYLQEYARKALDIALGGKRIEMKNGMKTLKGERKHAEEGILDDLPLPTIKIKN